MGQIQDLRDDAFGSPIYVDAYQLPMPVAHVLDVPVDAHMINHAVDRLQSGYSAHPVLAGVLAEGEDASR
jgi:hypothetical protein